MFKIHTVSEGYILFSSESFLRDNANYTYYARVKSPKASVFEISLKVSLF